MVLNKIHIVTCRALFSCLLMTETFIGLSAMSKRSKDAAVAEHYTPYKSVSQQVWDYKHANK